MAGVRTADGLAVMNVAARAINYEPVPRGLCLFTPEHIELQRDLHARYNYGKGVDVAECAMLVRGLAEYGSTVLDYGCGQGHFKRVLGIRYDVREYDPAIPGKDDRPESADVVVCADVLEHVEPAFIDNLFSDLRNLTRTIAIMVIATRPSQKIMANGEQSHTVVMPAEWWRERIERRFVIDGFTDRTDTGHGLLVVARPRAVVKLGPIHVTSAVADTERNDNVRINIAKVSKRLAVAKGECPAHDRVAVLACFGPSLRETWPQIAMAQATGADVFTVSGSHQFLLERGIVPVAHMDCDPREHKAFQFGEPDHRVKYWIGSCVHPVFIERLEGHDVSLWHCYNKDASREIFKLDPGHEMIVGGGSIGLRALSVLYCRGYRKFEIHAMDSCSLSSGQHHAGFHYAKYPGVAEIRVGDRWFLATAIHVAYARYFFKSQKMLKGSTFTFHGNGLLAEMVKQGQMPGVEFDETDDVQL